MNLRILGTSERNCCNKLDCPNVFEMETGDFAIVGLTRTEELREFLPHNAGCGPTEDVVVVPRAVMLAAIQDISLK